MTDENVATSQVSMHRPIPPVRSRSTEDLVITPGGLRPRSAVHDLRQGQHVSLKDGRIRIIDTATGTVVLDLGEAETVDATEELRLRDHDPTLSTPALKDVGWIQNSQWRNASSNPVVYFSTKWVIPPAPTSNDGQEIYLFNGMQPDGGAHILQPVLQWGADSAAGGGAYWAITNWYADGQGGTSIKKPAVQVNVGDVLQGVITCTGSSTDSKGNTTYNYTSSFVGHSSLDCTVTDAPQLTWAYETLEAYGTQIVGTNNFNPLTQASDYPNTLVTAMFEIELRTGTPGATGTQASVTWQAVTNFTDVPLNCQIASNNSPGGEVDLFYRGQFAIANVGSVRTDSRLAALARLPQHEDVFWIGAVGDISSNWRDDKLNGGAWHAQFGIAAPGSVHPGSPVVATARFPQQNEAFWIGAVGDISSNWRNDNVDKGAWHSQFAVAQAGSVRADSPLDVVHRLPQHEDVFWVGANGDVSSNWRDDNLDSGAWHAQFGIAAPGSVHAGSPLVATARFPQQNEVFWVGAVGDISSNWRNDNVDSGAWHSQFAIAQAGSVRADSPLCVVHRLPQHEDVFWVGANGDVSSNWRDDNLDSGAWHAQFGLAVPSSVRAGSPLIATARFPQQNEVFWIGAVGDISSNWRNDKVDNGAWHSQFGLVPPGTVRDDSSLAVIHRTPQREDVFYVKVDGSIGNLWRDDNVDVGRWHAQTITAVNSVHPGSPLIAMCRLPNILEVFWVGAPGDISSTYLSY